MRRLEFCPAQFAVFRVMLGLFLAHHFLALVPHATELYGANGMFPPNARTSFPNALIWLDSHGAIRGAFLALASLSIALALGLFRQVVAILLWYGWACLVNRVPYLFIPSEGLVGWLLLLTAAVPSGEPFSVYPRPSGHWRMPGILIASLWFVIGIGYLASGVDKLTSPSWLEGTALRTILMGPMARWTAIADLSGSLPDAVIMACTWLVLAIEIGFIALIWHPRTRALAWMSITTMHVSIRVLLDLHTISDPFLISQVLAFEPGWLKRARPIAEPSTKQIG